MELRVLFVTMSEAASGQTSPPACVEVAVGVRVGGRGC